MPVSMHPNKNDHTPFQPTPVFVLVLALVLLLVLLRHDSPPSEATTVVPTGGRQDLLSQSA